MHAMLLSRCLADRRLEAKATSHAVAVLSTAERIAGQGTTRTQLPAVPRCEKPHAGHDTWWQPSHRPFDTIRLPTYLPIALRASQLAIHQVSFSAHYRSLPLTATHSLAPSLTHSAPGRNLSMPLYRKRNRPCSNDNPDDPVRVALD
jgi:hypothetical protein